MPREVIRAVILTLAPLLVWLPNQSSCANPASGAASGSKDRFPPCSHGVEFFSSQAGACVPCTECAPDFTLSPCAVHKDAICGPLSALELDWSFLASGKKMADRKSAGLDGATSNILWRFADVESRRPADEGVRESAAEQEVANVWQKRGRRRSSFADEELWWDWQTGALVLAVCACALFFLVAGCSALVYARQWRRMKRNFQPAGLEEISARLNFLVKAELAELVAGSAASPADPDTRCRYLEKLLDRKREATPTIASWPEVGGNVYIEEGIETRVDGSQIAKIHRSVDDAVGRKRPTPT